MSISVSVPLDALQNPRVAQALSDLMLSLAGASGAVSAGDGRRKARTAAAANPAPKASAPAPSAEAEAQPRRRGRRPKAAAAAAAAAAPAAAAPAGRGDGARYQSFIEGLPKPSRAFLDLIRERGELTLGDAVRELNITAPKAIGGITGSLSRWARERNVPLPFEAGKNSAGERVWRWVRPGGEGNAAEGGRSRGRSREQAPRASSRRRRSSGDKAADEGGTPRPPANLANPPPAIGEALFDDPRYTQWVDGMGELAREFLVTLSERGEITMAEALKRFGLTLPGALSDVVRGLRERAGAQRSPLPFEEARSRSNERMWRWTAIQEARGPSRTRAGVVVRKQKKESAPSAP